jgi:hypothetical protein
MILLWVLAFILYLFFILGQFISIFGKLLECFNDIMNALADLIEGVSYAIANSFCGKQNGEIIFLEQYSKRQVIAGLIQTGIWGLLILILLGTALIIP